ncbi:NIPSNAP family protein [Flammeovirgaceae bacterium SG7u.111]|nr:NIPSNAP family protein [Flammeovirgaceae bacterium SG7u.132]WPO33140.1 NIPSNAP family protein [Flammeovirgaceae bacterium SG7u.111]
MKRRNFVKNAATASMIVGSLTSSTLANATPKATRELYEIRVYQLKNRGGLNKFGAYLKDALIPAMNRAGVNNIGVFTELHSPEPPRVYVILPYSSEGELVKVPSKLQKDSEFAEAAKKHNETPSANAVYSRMESSLLYAFEGMPQMEKPTGKAGIFELREYESHNADAGLRKIAMFNNEEIELFRKVKLNPLFFGQTIIGSKLPSLTYMLWFEDMDAREANWKKFLEHPDWNEMKNKKEYKDSVSKVNKIYLEPVEYSQI